MNVRFASFVAPMLLVVALGSSFGFTVNTHKKKLPARCKPLVCGGHSYPTCSPEGYPINYFRNPCAPLPRR